MRWNVVAYVGSAKLHNIERSQIAIGKMFTHKPFIQNKAVINGETEQICRSVSQPRFNISKNPSVTRCSIWYRLLNSFQNFEHHNSRSKKWIPVMLSRITTCCKISDFNP